MHDPSEISHRCDIYESVIGHIYLFDIFHFVDCFAQLLNLLTLTNEIGKLETLIILRSFEVIKETQNDSRFENKFTCRCCLCHFPSQI